MASVLVTGGTRGIGAGIVDTLVAHGFNVGFCGRSLRPETEARAQALSGTYGVKVRAYACDISDAASREALLDAFTADFGSLEVLVNNAGIAPKVRCDLLDMSEESFEELLRTNLQGPFFLTQSAARRMIADAKTTEFRCIINIGSVSADYVSVNRGEYCLSKAGVAMATKLWAVRLADAQIPAMIVPYDRLNDTEALDVLIVPWAERIPPEWEEAAGKFGLERVMYAPRRPTKDPCRPGPLTPSLSPRSPPRPGPCPYLNSRPRPRPNRPSRHPSPPRRGPPPAITGRRWWPASRAATPCCTATSRIPAPTLTACGC